MPIMSDIQFIAVAPFECKCENVEPCHVCVSTDPNHIPIKLADITQNLQWKICRGSTQPEYVIAGVRFPDFNSAKEFAKDYAIVRPFTIMPQDFTGFTIRGTLFFESIQDVNYLRDNLPKSRHEYWVTLANDLFALYCKHRAMSRAYNLEETREETLKQGENGTHCVSCNADLHMKSYEDHCYGDGSWPGVSMAILEQNYIVLCPKCAAAGIHVIKRFR